mgnify:FL=1
MNSKSPRSLIQLTRDDIRRFGKFMQDDFLFFLRQDSFNRAELYVFGAPVEISHIKQDGFFINPEGSTRLEWYIDPAREKSKDLWGSFSEELIMLRLKGTKRRYEVHCGQADSLLGMGVNYENLYRMSRGSPQYARTAFHFGAREMVRVAGITDLLESELNKLAKFLITDFKTEKYKQKSKEIGLEADSVFFP